MARGTRIAWHVIFSMANLFLLRPICFGFIPDLMPFPRVTEIAHQIASECLFPGAKSIDATVGNGFDTLFLAQQVSSSGRVDGFDIQPTAITSTRQIITDHPQVHLHPMGHEFMAQVVHHPVQVVMFNLGYLPSGDHQLTTQRESTITALNAAFSLLSVTGRITVVVYPGHSGGLEEAEAVEEWFRRHSSREFTVIRYAPLSSGKPSPYLLAGEKG